MKFHVLTLFPELVSNAADVSILGRAIKKGVLSVSAVNIRDYATGKHHKTDDYTYGGGAGMLMQAQPVYDAYKAVEESAGRRVRVIYLTPQGSVFDQAMAEEFAKEEELVFLCGHYEGVDERVLEEIVTDYVSIGDYVLTGGELAALVMIDAIARLVPGVLHNEDSAQTESFSQFLLEYPQYSRPPVWHGKAVPDVLLSGNHKQVAAWRLAQSVERTRKRRPDLYEKYRQLEDVYERLKEKKLLHILMLESIRRGNASLCAVSDGGVLLFDKPGGVYMLSAQDANAGRMLIRQLQNPRRAELFVVHQPFLYEVVEEETGMQPPALECIQAVYTRGVLLPERMAGRGEIGIRVLGEESLGVVCGHYHHAPEEYVLGRLKSGALYGAFLGGEMAGFIGMHAEGSIGMLEVFQNYKRQGIGAAMESFLINRMLEKGWTPFAQIVSDNVPSICLQKKLGLAVSKEKIAWYWR